MLKDVKHVSIPLGCQPDWANILLFKMSNHHIHVSCAIHTADSEHNGTSSFPYPCSPVTTLSVSASDLGGRVSILLAVSYIHPF
jgi:hypothetical protein